MCLPFTAIMMRPCADWSDVVEMTSYHTDLPAQGRIMIAVKGKHMAEPYPAWTAIDVDRLWPDNGFAEIRLTLYAPER
jgi:enamine deaminase RidA (YjgF/YER057c/UK114 family)